MGQVMAGQAPDAPLQTGGQLTGEDLRAGILAREVGGDGGQIVQGDARALQAIAHRLPGGLDEVMVVGGLEAQAEAVFLPVQPLLLNCDDDLTVSYQSARTVVTEIDSQMPGLVHGFHFLSI